MKKLSDEPSFHRINDLLARVSSDKSLTVNRYVKTARHRTPHFHDFYELELVESGRGECMVNDIGFSLARGDMLLLRTTDIHTYEIPKDGSLTVCTLRFSFELERELSDALEVPRILATRLGESELSHILVRIYEISDSQNSRFADLLGKSLVTELCIRLLRSLDEKPRRVADSSPVARAVELIMCEYSRRITVTSIAERLGVSPNYLGKCFSESMRISLNRYIARVRIAAAVKLLSDPTLPIKQIAIDCGFGSASVFSREFRRSKGCSPGEFRESHEFPIKSDSGKQQT